jgi:hypothetical protein
VTYRSAFLIANNVNFEETLPIEIGNDVTLRRPSNVELEKIQEILQTSTGNRVHWFPYEAIITLKEENEDISFVHADDQDNFHYYLLSDDYGGRRVHDLEQALLLLNPSIDLSIRIASMFEEGNQLIKVIGASFMMLHIYERYHYGIPTSSRFSLTTAQLQLAEDIRQKINSLAVSYEFIKYAAQMLKELRTVSQSSRFQVIGFFSIIESLVTHKPRLAESLDSISFQLRGKLRLLNNRMEQKSLLTEIFGKLEGKDKEKEVWNKLYSYRSVLAHGSAIDFNVKTSKDKETDFSILISSEKVVKFLSMFTRNLLLHALEEPQLFADLKEC